MWIRALSEKLKINNDKKSIRQEVPWVEQKKKDESKGMAIGAWRLSLRVTPKEERNKKSSLSSEKEVESKRLCDS